MLSVPSLAAADTLAADVQQDIQFLDELMKAHGFLAAMASLAAASPAAAAAASTKAAAAAASTKASPAAVSPKYPEAAVVSYVSPTATCPSATSPGDG
ncbi:hypothetical protein HXX76_016276 [Chlamydomonas incerta]|uniref:Uncharacterized protein n=1 Tax=Chlamydomonas incerta TaxID=51695 RepID=A0A835SK37_CHLIN|nr:hypothetical protein HXX76_016276 [Chlamydomonas incerta]|eukprot:KAG2422100.1 hypothetical protein HXX76_016276 [Chlamydomonas incerta]